MCGLLSGLLPFLFLLCQRGELVLQGPLAFGEFLRCLLRIVGQVRVAFQSFGQLLQIIGGFQLSHRSLLGVTALDLFDRLGEIPQVGRLGDLFVLLQFLIGDQGFSLAIQVLLLLLLRSELFGGVLGFFSQCFAELVFPVREFRSPVEQFLQLLEQFLLRGCDQLGTLLKQRVQILRQLLVAILQLLLFVLLFLSGQRLR